MTHTRYIFRFILLAALALASVPAHAEISPDNSSLPQSILHTLDYLSVDYPGSVSHGQVVNEAEYHEQQEFAGELGKQFAKLPDNPAKAGISADIAKLVRLIDNKAEGHEVQSLSAALAADIIRSYQVQVSPRSALSLAAAATLFQAQCAGCHGADGFGNGPLAASLTPIPSNFHNRERQAQRSVYGLFSTITLGVDGTAMRSFHELTEKQRWALALYVSQFYSTDAERAQGAALWNAGRFQDVFKGMPELTQATPAELEASHGSEAVAVLGHLRSNPNLVLNADKLSPLAITRLKLQQSRATYQTGENRQAYELAVSAYLEGFELAEASLGAVDMDMKKAIEVAMSNYRQAIKQGAAVSQINQQAHEIEELLDKAEISLSSTHLSPAMGFTSAFIILLREGLEAILVLAALAAFLIKSDQRHALRYIHAGWIAAVALGFCTWLVAKYLIDLSGASRELTEGMTALIAAGMLVYVGFWLHSHSHAQRWKQFIHGKVNHAVGEGTLWGLVVISFLAVYREIFEIVLFYEALWQQADQASSGYVFGGIVTAAFALLVLGWGIFKLGVRLPLRLFFSVNAVLLMGLAIIFAGKGIAAMQKAGKLNLNPLDIPTIDLLGIYPSWEGFGLQMALLVASIAWVGYTWLQDRSRGALAKT